MKKINFKTRLLFLVISKRGMKHIKNLLYQTTQREDIELTLERLKNILIIKSYARLIESVTN